MGFLVTVAELGFSLVLIVFFGFLSVVVFEAWRRRLSNVSMEMVTTLEDPKSLKPIQNLDTLRLVALRGRLALGDDKPPTAASVNVLLFLYPDLNSAEVLKLLNSLLPILQSSEHWRASCFVDKFLLFHEAPVLETLLLTLSRNCPPIDIETWIRIAISRGIVDDLDDEEEDEGPVIYEDKDSDEEEGEGIKEAMETDEEADNSADEAADGVNEI